jgi:hypothetical protein
LKKLTAIFLLVCLIAPISGTYIWLKHELKVTKREVKRQIIAGLDDSELVTFKFSKSDADICLKWKHSKEFEYRGEMYDVVKSLIKGDTIIYTCWWDNKETKLNKQLAHLMGDIMGSHPQNKENHKRLVNFYKSLFYENSSELLGFYPNSISNSYYPFNNFIYEINCSAPPVPPPEIG